MLFVVLFLAVATLTVADLGNARVARGAQVAVLAGLAIVVLGAAAVAFTA